MDMNSTAAARLGITDKVDTIVLRANAALTYADTNQHLLTIPQPVLKFYKEVGLQIKIKNKADTDAANLTIRALSLPVANAAPLTAATLVRATWDSVVCALNEGTPVVTETWFLEDIKLRGKYLYVSYQYSANPGAEKSPEVEIVLFGV